MHALGASDQLVPTMSLDPANHRRRCRRWKHYITSTIDTSKSVGDSPLSGGLKVIGDRSTTPGISAGGVPSPAGTVPWHTPVRRRWTRCSGMGMSSPSTLLGNPLPHSQGFRREKTGVSLGPPNQKIMLKSDLGEVATHLSN